ncbi:MAG: hypothetical protein ACYCPT_14085 [Acidimicrobiales bacterium]
METMLGYTRQQRERALELLTPAGRELYFRRREEWRDAYDEALRAAQKLRGRKRDVEIGEIAEEYGLTVRQVYTLIFSPDALGI